MEKMRQDYGLKDPQAIKMRIIWMAMKQLIKVSYGDSPKNKKMLDHFDRQWKRVEQAEKDIN